MKKFEGLSMADRVRSSPVGLTLHDLETGNIVESQGIELDDLE